MLKSNFAGGRCEYFVRVLVKKMANLAAGKDRAAVSAFAYDDIFRSEYYLILNEELLHKIIERSKS